MDTTLDINVIRMILSTLAGIAIVLVGGLLVTDLQVANDGVGYFMILIGLLLIIEGLFQKISGWFARKKLI